jgi:hypothetical protein
MTKLLDMAIEVVRALPPETQDEIARVVLQMAEAGRDPEPITADQLAYVLDRLLPPLQSESKP